MAKRFEKLAVPLTDDEVLLKGEELARRRKEWEAKKAERKAVVASFKKQIDELDDQIRDLADVVKTRREQRDIEVVEQRNESQGLVETVRADTGEVVRSRAMTAGERQVSLFSLPGGKGKRAGEREETSTDPAPASAKKGRSKKGKGAKPTHDNAT